MNFSVLKIAIAKQFELMQKHPLFRVAIDRDTVWETYLASFPAGTNEKYRERTEHDCACCRNFVKNIGNVVAMINGKMVSVWDILTPTEPDYQIVTDALAKMVKASPIENVFLHYENTAGAKPNFEQMTTGVKTWEHFFVNIQSKFVRNGKDIASTLGPIRQLKEVFLRGLTEIDIESVNTVVELIAQNTVYRGEEHKFSVNGFRQQKALFDKLKTNEERELFAWTNSQTIHGAIAGIRNNSIGKLLQDLAGGMDVDHALSSFESLMGAANYKRPTAAVTKKMIDAAKVTIEGLGYTSALERRHATIDDLTINNILHANREARKIINNDVFDDLAAATGTKVKTSDKIEEVSIERFLAEILPRAESIEVLLENRHSSNLVSLIAPNDPTANNMFKWDNRFSYSYIGGMADTIKERVKAAGGSVEGDLCCRLAWDYDDDLDFHMTEPDGYKIYFGTKKRLSPNGGMLDIDANGGDGIMANPVENIFYANRSKMKEGIYTLVVNNYNRRSDGKGFEVEIEFDGQKTSIVYDRVMRSSKNIQVAKIKYSKINGFSIVESMPSTQSVKNIWGIPSQSFHKVNVMMMSPNFWDEQGVGNKHYFFMLEGCINNGEARGFLNEFLKDELTPHRKVMEMVGSRMKVAESERQLSGLGFSSTQKNTLVCRVKGSFTRTLQVVF